MTTADRPSKEQVPDDMPSLRDSKGSFRIPPELSLLNAAFLECIPESAQKASTDSPRNTTSIVSEHWIKALASIATNAWRAKKRLSASEASGGNGDTSLLLRHISGVIESLTEMELEIEDWTDALYDPGLPLRVVSFEATPGLSRDAVTETIKPSVKLQGQLIQIGEVIVGTASTQS